MKQFLFVLILAFVLKDGMSATTTKAPPHEKFEVDNVVFTYESSTQILIVVNRHKCYLNLLTPDEKAVVHNDIALRKLELRILSVLDTAYFTSVPRDILHPAIVRACSGISHSYYLVHGTVR